MEAGTPVAPVDTPPAAGPNPNPNAPPTTSPPKKPSVSEILKIANLVSRILTAIFLLIALVIHATTTGFDTVISYRYTMSAIVIGFVYELVQIGFALHRMIMAAAPTKCMLIFDFYGDKSISYFFATGAAAGFGAGIDMRRSLSAYNLDDFFNKGNAATSLLFISFLFSVASSVVSSYTLPKWNFA